MFYTAPEIEVVMLVAQDILNTNGVLIDGKELFGE